MRENLALRETLIELQRAQEAERESLETWKVRLELELGLGLGLQRESLETRKVLEFGLINWGFETGT